MVTRSRQMMQDTISQIAEGWFPNPQEQNVLEKFLAKEGHDAVPLYSKGKVVVKCDDKEEAQDVAESLKLGGWKIKPQGSNVEITGKK